MARGLHLVSGIMQIPYDLEFVENRPTVQVRAVAMDETYPFGRSRATLGRKATCSTRCSAGSTA